MGKLGGFFDLLVIGIGTAVGNIFGEGAVKQYGFLRHQADRLAQTFLSDLGNVLAVDEDASAIEVVEALNEFDKGALAAAGMAHQADAFAGADGYGKIVVQRRYLARVAKRDVVELDTAAWNH